jgi:hypothetical protein
MFSGACSLIGAILSTPVNPSIWPVTTTGFFDIISSPGSSGVFAKANLCMMYKKHKSIEFTLLDILGGACNGMKCSDQRNRIYDVLGLPRLQRLWSPGLHPLRLNILCQISKHYGEKAS